jgi:hypothetical protein
LTSAYDKALIKCLQAAGHRVITPPEAGSTGARDAVHFRRAKQEGWILLTKNPRDFVVLHEADRDHAGALVIYQDNDPGRDMTHMEIVGAIANLERAAIPLAGEIHILNRWRY